MTNRILHVISGLDTGGAEGMLLKILKQIERNQAEHIVLSLSSRGVVGEAIAKLGIPVHALGMDRGLPRLSDVRRLVNLANELQPALIQGWMYHGNLAAQLMSACLPYRPPVLWNIRAARTDLGNQKLLTAGIIWMGARLSGFPAYILNNSRASARDHIEKLGYKPDRSVIIPNGFDTDLFAPSEASRQAIRRELGVSDEAVLVGLIGRFHPVKDHANFFLAVARLRERHPNLHVVLAGQGLDEANPELRVLTETTGFSSQLHLLGLRRDIPQLNTALDISCSSSFSEGFPNAIGEAMSSGVPCVVTDVGDSGYLVGETGRVVRPRDPEALAEEINALIEIGASARRDLGIRARQRIIENFSISTVAKIYQEVYNEALSHSNRAKFGL